MDITHVSSIYKLIDEIHSSEMKSALVPFSIDDEAKSNFCILVSLIDGNHELKEPVYNVHFVEQNTNSPEQTFNKNWGELEKETGIDFKTMLSEPGMDEMKDEDNAIITVFGQKNLEVMLKLCEDIAHSIKLGGLRPLDAGKMFEYYFNPKDILSDMSITNPSTELH